MCGYVGSVCVTLVLAFRCFFAFVFERFSFVSEVLLVIFQVS